jgi:hypothetical protein
LAASFFVRYFSNGVDQADDIVVLRQPNAAEFRTETIGGIEGTDSYVPLIQFRF